MAICSGNTAMAREPPLRPGAQLLVETSFGTPALKAAAIVRPRGKSLMAKRCLKSSWNHIKSSPTWGGEEKQKLLINKYFCLCVGFFPSDEILYFNTFWQEILLINNQEKDHLSVVHLKIELWVKGLGYLSCYLSICLV